MYQNTFLCLCKEISQIQQDVMTHHSETYQLRPYLRAYGKEAMASFFNSIALPERCHCDISNDQKCVCRYAYVEYVMNWIKDNIVADIRHKEMIPADKYVFYDSCIRNVMFHMLTNKRGRGYHGLRNHLHYAAQGLYRDLQRN